MKHNIILIVILNNFLNQNVICNTKTISLLNHVFEH